MSELLRVSSYVKENVETPKYCFLPLKVSSRCAKLSLTTSIDRRESAVPVVDTKVQTKRCHRPRVFLPKIKRWDLGCFSESVGMRVCHVGSSFRDRDQRQSWSASYTKYGAQAGSNTGRARLNLFNCRHISSVEASAGT